MIITSIAPVTKAASKVYIDGTFAFLLYRQDLRRHHLEEDMELSKEAYEKILSETLIPRAKRKVMDLLERCDRSEFELRTKLKAKYYPQEVIDAAIAYVDGYHYIDDERLAYNYVAFHKEKKSILELRQALLKKGISKEIISNVLSEVPIDETEALLKALHKKCKDVTELDYSQKQKVAAYLYRKGFRDADIRKHLNL
ncbi:MAG: recombination regulator RecX [Lachnospiraceae bacterium]|nr:recombination regulator RecX [Lachnospiraceae bacterium]